MAEKSQIFYSAEEPGCCLYWTNDPDVLKNPFIIDGCLYGEDRNIAKFFGYSDDEIQETELIIHEYDIPEKRVNEALNNARKVYPGLKNLNDIAFKESDSFFNVFEYTYVDLNETE